MSHQLSVQVLDADGDPVEGVSVKMTIAGTLDGGELNELTEEDGQAEFETVSDYEDSRELWIKVRDQEFGPYEIVGGSYTVTLD
jgi:hypothetical protein